MPEPCHGPSRNAQDDDDHNHGGVISSALVGSTFNTRASSSYWGLAGNKGIDSNEI